MSTSPVTQSTTTDRSVVSASRVVGVIPNFHHVPSTSAVALESYIHLYLESSALVESALKPGAERNPV